MLPYTYPIEWLSSRRSSPIVLLQNHPQNRLLVELVAAMLPGDEIRRFNSPRENWRRKAGRTGYALVRQGKPLVMVVTALS